MKQTYNKVTSKTIKDIIKIAGKENVFLPGDGIEDYYRDEMPFGKPHKPNVLIKPVNTAAVSSIVKYAGENNIPVTPRGAGTGLNGGCVPIFGGILLSLENMNRILEIDQENFVAVVEPGVPLKEIYAATEAKGLYYPVHPGELIATIGGTIATNAGGMNAVRYGVTRQNILGLEAVLPDGDVIETGGKFVKCSTGYDFTNLLIGSEGTLAIVTKAILKLTTKPPCMDVLWAPFSDLQNAIDAVPEILKLKKIPNGLEFLEKSVVEIGEKYMERDIPFHQYAAFLMVIMDGETTDEIYDYFAKVEEICKKHGAVEGMVPNSEKAKRELFEFREKLFHAINRYAPMEIADIVVPRSEIARFVKQVKQISQKRGVPVLALGHAGDGNVHLHPICIDMPIAEWHKKVGLVMKDLYKAGLSFGGNISGEHGIGYGKKSYLRNKGDDALLNAMRQVKTALDPNNILNPGKIF